MRVKTPKILIIEDDRSIRHVLTELLELEGYEVRCAENGRIALDLLGSSEWMPDLILLDLMMPVMDGWEFREMQIQDARISQVPVVVMTADGQAHARMGMFRPNGLVRKPIDIEDFLITLQTLSA